MKGKRESDMRTDTWTKLGLDPIHGMVGRMIVCQAISSWIVSLLVQWKNRVKQFQGTWRPDKRDRYGTIKTIHRRHVDVGQYVAPFCMIHISASHRKQCVVNWRLAPTHVDIISILGTSGFRVRTFRTCLERQDSHAALCATNVHKNSRHRYETMFCKSYTAGEPTWVTSLVIHCNSSQLCLNTTVDEDGW